MKPIIKLLLVGLVLTQSLFAQIIEADRMEEILDRVTPASLVIFDLDNTIMEAAQSVGSDQWFEHHLTQLKSQGIPPDEAIQMAVRDWEKVNLAGRVQLVEEETPEIIHGLQSSQIPTMGLTARPKSFQTKSLSQLKGFGINLAAVTPTKKTVEITEQDTALFNKGLLSVGNNNKGKILVKFLKQIGFHPKRVIFVDDKVKNVTHVDEALAAAGIESYAFRYGAADWKVKNFNGKLSDFEFDYFKKFGVVLSDAEAKQLMH